MQFCKYCMFSAFFFYIHNYFSIVTFFPFVKAIIFLYIITIFSNFKAPL